MGKRIDVTGQKFGKLTAVRNDRMNKHGEALWICECECGTEIEIPSHRLRNGHTKSCGCYRRQEIGNRSRTHGKSKTPQYSMFYDARKRASFLNLPFNIIPSDIVVPEKCPVLGISLSQNCNRDNRPSLDKVIPSEGYTPENIKVISFRANRIKSDANLEELIAVTNYVREHEIFKRVQRDRGS